MNLDDLSEGSKRRLKKIQELRGGDEKQVLEYCISVGWVAAERTDMYKKRNKDA